MNFTKGNILIIDDDPLILMSYSDILMDNDYNATECSNCTQGLNAVSSGDYNLVICDHDLGDGKGSSIVAKLFELKPSTPVLYLTGATSKALEEVEKFPNIKEIIYKPITEEKLIESVEKYIKKTDNTDHYPKLINNKEREILLGIFDKQE